MLFIDETLSNNNSQVNLQWTLLYKKEVEDVLPHKPCECRHSLQEPICSCRKYLVQVSMQVGGGREKEQDRQRERRTNFAGGLLRARLACCGGIRALACGIRALAYIVPLLPPPLGCFHVLLQNLSSDLH